MRCVSDQAQPLPPILTLQQVEMNFGGVIALNRVSCEIPQGMIHAVIGPNGAGKTTLFNCVSGLLRPSAGAILLEGRPIQGLPPNQIARLGISRTFQHIALFKNMSVLENVMLGRHVRSRAGFWRPVCDSPACAARNGALKKRPCPSSNSWN